MPESRTRTRYGVILQPSFLPKLAMSIDYFDIEIEDTISTFGVDNTLQRLLSLQGDTASCDRIQRDDERFAVARRRPRASTSTPTSVRSRRRATT